MTANAPCQLWTVGTWSKARQIGNLGLCFSPDSQLGRRAVRAMYYIWLRPIRPVWWRGSRARTPVLRFVRYV